MEKEKEAEATADGWFEKKGQSRVGGACGCGWCPVKHSGEFPDVLRGNIISGPRRLIEDIEGGFIIIIIMGLYSST